VATRFVGRYEHSLDGKGRIILPARFRANFEVLAFVSKDNEQCLSIWTPEAFERKADEMALLLEGTPEQRARARAWSMGSAEVDMDRQGRVAIPGYLREFAQLTEGETVLVHGAVTHIELWNPSIWEAQGALGDAALTGSAPAGPAAAGSGTTSPGTTSPGTTSPGTGGE